MLNWIKKLVGDSNDKAVKQIQPLVNEVNGLENGFKALSDEGLRETTLEKLADHGNGQQDIFYLRQSVLTVSIHAASGQASASSTRTSWPRSISSACPSATRPRCAAFAPRRCGASDRKSVV